MKSSEINFANPTLKDIDFEINVPPKRNALIGYLIVITIIAIIILSILLSIISIIKRVGGCLVLWAIYAAVGALIATLWRSAQRYLHNPLILESDSRAPTLYLRSFSSDWEEDSSRKDKKTPEELLVSIFGHVGPVITVGNLRENLKTLPYPGATRIYLPNDWKTNVEKLMSISKFIVINVNRSENLLWELATAREHIIIEKLFITFLVEHNTPIHEKLYKEFAPLFKRIFAVEIPPYDEDICFICFNADWTPHPIIIRPICDDVRSKIPFVKLKRTEFYLSEEDIQKALFPIIQYHEFFPVKRKEKIKLIPNPNEKQNQDKDIY